MSLNAAHLIPDHVDLHASLRPDACACRYRDRSVSYAELAARSNALACALLEEGVRRHDRVAILMEKSEHTATAMHGIMKAGAAYVPLDHTAPANRIRQVLDDCGIRHVVAGGRRAAAMLAAISRDTPLECVIGADFAAPPGVRLRGWASVLAAPSHRPDVKVLEDDLAYIIYTSGSTGIPKGIMHTHRSGLAFARWAAAEYGLRSDDRLSNHAPLHFDLSIFDWFAAAVVGAATLVIPEEHTRVPASYSTLLEQERVSVLFTVPFALVQLAVRGALEERDLSALRWVIFGGEPMPVKHLEALMRMLPGAAFDNMYGPAEVNGCTHYTVPRDRPLGANVPIGPICSIAEALVVDEQDRPVIPGEPGELLVRTPTMMQGYWARADVSARAFLRTEAIRGHAHTYYRTGDLVRDRGDGVFDFLGRKDRQIKVRGYRIELDEVEAVLLGHPDVLQAAAFATVDAERAEIGAAVIPRPHARLEPAALRRHLAERLPAYAVPCTIEVLAAFPTTASGKIDRLALKDRSRSLSGQAGTRESTATMS